MRKLPRILLLILLPFLLIGLSLGTYFLVNEIRIQNNIAAMRNENDLFYAALEAEGIDIRGYVLYEEVFLEEGGYFLIFTEDATSAHEEGDLLQGILLRVHTDVSSEYSPSIECGKEDTLYILPFTWMAGGGSALASSESFRERAEIRRAILEDNAGVTTENITIRIEGSVCLGKLEL